MRGKCINVQMCGLVYSATLLGPHSEANAYAVTKNRQLWVPLEGRGERHRVSRVA